MGPGSQALFHIPVLVIHEEQGEQDVRTKRTFWGCICTNITEVADQWLLEHRNSPDRFSLKSQSCKPQETGVNSVIPRTMAKT